MTERFVTNAGTISIGTGESTVIGVGTTFGGRDRAGAQLYAYVGSNIIKIGTVAEVDPRGEYEDLSLPLTTPYPGLPIVAATYELVDSIALLSGASPASIFARYAAHLEQNMGLVGNLADTLIMSLVPENSLFIDDVTQTIYQWRGGVLNPVHAVGQPFNPRGDYSAGVSYSINDLVQHGGYLFVSIIDTNVGNTPDTAPASNASWTYLPIPSVVIATATEYRVGTNTTKPLGVKQTWDAALEVVFPDVTNIVVDMATFINATVTLGGNRTLSNPINKKFQQSGYIRIVQDATGGRTLAFGSHWKFAENITPVLSTAAGAEDLLFYIVLGATRVLGSLVKAIPA